MAQTDARDQTGTAPAGVSPDEGADRPLVVVSNRLPVERRRGEDGQWRWEPSSGGLVTALEPVVEQTGGVWIGWNGIASDAQTRAGRAGSAEAAGRDDEDASGSEDGESSPDAPTEPFEVEGPAAGKPFTIVPVALSAQEVERYYEGFSNGTLWPLYHDVIAPPEYHRIWWDAYVHVNRRFAEAAARTAAPGSRVWIQDYQLQLVPQMLRELRPDVSIGFFDHIPFPPEGLFRQLPWRRLILQGLLGADLIGFQRAEDARNFAQAVRRLLGWTVHRGTVEVPLEDGQSRPGGAALVEEREREQGRDAARDRTREDCRPGMRSAHFGAFPISVDFASWDRLANRSDVRARAAEIRRELGNPRTVLLGVDRLDYTKGIAERLKAYGELLDEHALDVQDAVLIEMAIPTREGVSAYQDLREEVEVATSRINGEHSTVGRTAVQYLHRNLPRAEVAALYEAADILLVTSLRDGMNLVAKEYVAASVDVDGVLILSEFTGAADELGRQALMVNPHDVDDIKTTILRAVGMAPRERSHRMRRLRRTVRIHDVAAWSDGFLAELERVAWAVPVSTGASGAGAGSGGAGGARSGSGEGRPA